MPVKKRSLGKKLAIVFGGLFALLVAAAVIIPFVVDVDEYRPQVVELVNQRLNGKLELGKLTLSLWGQIKVQVDGFTLSDSRGRKVVAAKDVYFHVPFLSVFSGSPVLTFRMERPEVNVVKDRAGRMNVLTLMKPAPETPPPAAQPEEKGGGLKSVPGVVANARLGVEMRNARLAYVDAATDLTTRVNDLNVQVKDISLTRTMKLAVWADLDTRMGKTLQVKGPFRVTGEMVPEFQGAEFRSAALDLFADADNVVITLPDLFQKKSGVPARVQAKVKATADGVAAIESLEATFHNARLTAKGKVGQALDLSVTSNDIALGPWAELVPLLKTYELEGSALLKASLSGTSEAPRYAADLAAKNVRVKGPMMKAKPEIQALVQVVTDRVKDLMVQVKAPGSSLSVKGNLISFTRPRFDVAVTSPGMDLDQLIEFPPPAKGGAPSAGAASGQASGAAAPAQDFDALLDPMRKNPMLAATSGNLRFNLASVKMKNVAMTDINGQMSLRDLAASLDRFAMKLFGGTVGASLASQLKPKTPTYRFSLDVNGLDLQRAVESQFALFRNTLTGKSDFKLAGTGASFNPDPAKRNLDAKGTFRVKDGNFATIDVGKMAAEAINRAAEKVAALKGKRVSPPGNQEATYETIGSDFSIQGGKFEAPNFQAVAKAGKGIDLKGATTVGLLDYSLNANWEIVDTHNLTKARDISVTEQGVSVNNLLGEGGGPVKLPVKVTGTLFSPNVNYGAVPEYLAKVAANNIARAAGDKVKAETQKKVQEQVQKAAGKAPPQVQKAIEGLGKKLFGK